MRDDSNARRTAIDRRSILTVGAGTLAGLGTLSVVQTAAAQDGDEWPVGEPDDGRDADGWDEPVPEDPDYGDQQQVTDETGTIQTSIPSDWNDVSGTPRELGPALVAAPDLEGYATTWDVPGIEIVVTTELGTDPEVALDSIADFSEFCEDAGRQQAQTPGYEFVSQGWTQCGGGETTFLSMAGVPMGESGGEAMDGSYLVLIGAQLVTEQDMGAINNAIGSLQTGSPDTGEGIQEQEVTDQLPAGSGTSLASGQTVDGEVRPGDLAAIYTYDDASAGDRLTLEVTRTGGMGQQGFSLTEPGGGPGLPYTIDTAMLEPDGTNVLTGQPGPVTLSGVTQVSGPGHSVVIIPSPYPEGIGPYQFTFVNEGPSQ
ncbi:hypothetical protein [Natronorubrum sulfidifaciens]|uniref:Peptidase S1 and S6, chymotrypsin/Hap n=1 Tax=Natronorubrum sulfidifaciens JCM 14089 TaxID=1230460 RepID=L9W5D3_9EURY|nr:hypothetical protein [Natronorubrum sulfidifaciens]ELY44689.1 peptidase S1 and S6, chymotrypsin/Hap [Natronorubrum sulfidifaciens JCM 14089]